MKKRTQDGNVKAQYHKKVKDAQTLNQRPVRLFQYLLATQKDT